jgi:hypothetical protein
VDANVCDVDGVLQLERGRRRCRSDELGVDGRRLRRRSDEEDYRDGMFAGIATLEMDAAVGAMCSLDLVLMGGRSMLVIRVVVVPVDMSVRDGTMAGADGQGDSEHDRQGALHNTECMHAWGSGQMTGCLLCQSGESLVESDACSECSCFESLALMVLQTQ